MTREKKTDPGIPCEPSRDCALRPIRQNVQLVLYDQLIQMYYTKQPIVIDCVQEAKAYFGGLVIYDSVIL